MNLLRAFLIIVLFLSFLFRSNSQQEFYPLSHYTGQKLSFLLNFNSEVHTGFKPILKSEIKGYQKIDSLIYRSYKEQEFFKSHNKNWIWRKLLFEDFISVKNGVGMIHSVLELELATYILITIIICPIIVEIFRSFIKFYI